MKKEYLLAGILAIALILLCIFSTKIIFHDTQEYITIAKNFASINNVDLFTTHSLLYPAVISVFLKIWPSFLTIKLINCFWIFLIGLVFLFALKDKRAFIIFAFSPIVWHTSIQTTPVLPAAFFFFLGYLFFKNEQIKNNYLYSGIFMGLSCAFYDVLFLVIAIFLVIHFFDKKVLALITYCLFILIGLLPRLIQDYMLFHNPLFSILKFFGTNAIISLGLSSSNKMINIVNWSSLALIFIISPFLFRIYKIGFKQNKREIIFLILSFAFLLLRAPMFKYFLILAPLILLMLSRVLTDREIKWHCIISIFIIVFLVHGYFGNNPDFVAQKDIEKIVMDYNSSYFVAAPYQANVLAVFLWKNEPRIVWYEDLLASLNNQTILKSYSFNFHSKIPLRETIGFSIDFKRDNINDYKNYVFVIPKATEFNESKLDRCYENLCVYDKLD